MTLRTRSCAALALLATTAAAVGTPTAGASRAAAGHAPAHHHRHRCAAGHARAHHTPAAPALQNIWGWGWQTGAFIAVAATHHRHGADQRHPAARCRGASHHGAQHGFSTTPPTGGGSGQGTSGSTPAANGAPGAGTSAPETLAPSGPPKQGGGETAPPSIAHIQVTAVEYHFTLSRTTVPAGKVAFDFVNSGQDEHNLNVLSHEGEIAGSFPDTASKGVRDQTIELRHGSYTLFCSLLEHAAKGMKATLTVE